MQSDQITAALKWAITERKSWIILKTKEASKGGAGVWCHPLLLTALDFVLWLSLTDLGTTQHITPPCFWTTDALRNTIFSDLALQESFSPLSALFSSPVLIYTLYSQTVESLHSIKLEEKECHFRKGEREKKKNNKKEKQLGGRGEKNVHTAKAKQKYND